MIEAVLFDVDGTLLESNDAHARAWVTALRAHGFEVPFSRVRPLIGMGGDRIIPELAGGISSESPTGKAIAKRRSDAYLSSELTSVRPTPGARSALAAVHARRARVGIATSATGEELERSLRIDDLGALVDFCVTAQDVRNSKPASDIIDAAVKKAGVPGERALMVGDTRYDIAAARIAGVRCVALLCGGNDPASLADAYAVYADPSELSQDLDRLAVSGEQP